jgi:putative ABC transport system permease protein
VWCGLLFEKGKQVQNYLSMIYNYFKIAIRFIGRNVSFTIINLIGLTAGIAAFLLIALFLQDQLGYDQKAPNSDRLYRLVGLQEPSGLDKQHVAITSAVIAPNLKEDFPQVEDAFRIMYAFRDIIEIDDKTFRENAMFFSEGKVIEHMGYPILHGMEAGKMLSLPNQAVVSRIAAEKFFNSSDVVGRVFKSGDHLYTITGVFENENFNSHLKAEVFLSFSTIELITPYLNFPGNNTLATYVLLHRADEAANLENLINEKYEAMRQENPHMMKNTFYLQKYTDIFLRSEKIKFHMFTHRGNINNVYIFSIVALLILFIACINFINLATANSSKRAKEVGLRKLLGAGRNKLAIQFIGESMIITLLSIVSALGVVELILPKYNALLDANLRIDFAANYLFNIGLMVILVIVGLTSGFYPALYLSKFEVGEVLRAGDTSGRPKSSTLRKILVVVQFVISTAMIMATIIVVQQVKHMQNKNLGYNHENVMAVYNRQTADYEKISAFRNQLLGMPEVKSAGISSGYNGVAGRQSMITTSDSVPVNLMVRFGYVDPDFFPAMQIDVVEGRNFSHNHGTDPRQTIIINRAAQRSLGWENPIGMRLLNTDDEEFDYYTVIGVIEDYHYYSLHNPIEPAVYIWRPGDMTVINVRYQTNNEPELMAKIQKEFETFFPGYYFHADFLSNILSRQYKTEKNTMQIFMWFALLCILISCLGLFGLTSFMVNQRRKEISIRKVLGSSMLKINMLLLASFMKWIILAALVALPFTYIIMNNWLDNFAYHIQIGAIQFVVTLTIITLIAASTILVLSTRAALKNPADTIKYE